VDFVFGLFGVLERLEAFGEAPVKLDLLFFGELVAEGV
jgi:hypothetical protein